MFKEDSLEILIEEPVMLGLGVTHTSVQKSKFFVSFTSVLID